MNLHGTVVRCAGETVSVVHIFNPVAKGSKCKKHKKYEKERFMVNKVFSSDANSLITEHTVMIKTYYNL
jgi:hypothetical protein